MRKIINYLCIAIIVLTFFSCGKKNEWTPEIEANFKEQVKEVVLKNWKYSTEKDADYVTDCIVEKYKARGLNPENSKNVLETIEIGKECLRQWHRDNDIKSYELDTWNFKSEVFIKLNLTKIYLKIGLKTKDIDALSDCIITKMKTQNLKPSDINNATEAKNILKIEKSCAQELDLIENK
ncbi:hypothetical protein [Flavobacterium sp. 3-210]